MAHHLEREIEKLKRQVLALGAKVEDHLGRACADVLAGLHASADVVIAGDADIDAAEVEIEEECLKILALHQPVAKDLRFVVAMLKLTSDLERIGDLGVNIAEQSRRLTDVPVAQRPPDLEEMVDRVRRMVSGALDSLVGWNTTQARSICAADDEVDRLHSGMYVWVCDAIRSNPDAAETLIQFLSVSRYLERIADHATNIAEDVIYMSEGEIVRHKGILDDPDSLN